MTSSTDVDPVTLSVIRGKIDQLVEEMELTLVQSAFSPIISEGLDMAAGLHQPNGDMIAQGGQGVQIFIGCMDFAIESILEKYDDDINPGDMFITNDPYVGGTHLHDVKLIKPMFIDGKLVSFLANTGHWIDIGAASPGGFGAESQEIYQEGIQIPSLKLYDEGEYNSEIAELLISNIRTAENLDGDLKAQENAIEVGERRFSSLCREYGVATIEQAIHDLKAQSEHQMRARIRDITDGTYSFKHHLDNDGVRDEPLPIELEIEVRNTDINLDFSGTAPSCDGPLNISRSTTVSACNLTLKHIFPDIPINAGCFTPVSFDIPDDSILDVSAPRPTGGYTETSQNVIGVVLGALSKALPESVPANPGSTAAATLIGGQTDENEEFVVLIAVSCGYGAFSDADGLSSSAPVYGRARMPPLEVQESRSPIRWAQIALREDSEGPGKYRGGFGVEYEIEVLADHAVVSVLADRGDHAPPGIAGGKPARGTRFFIVRDGARDVPPLRTKAQNQSLESGDRVHLESPGGGGYGPPAERQPQRVIDDVNKGYISRERAIEEYGLDESEL